MSAGPSGVRRLMAGAVAALALVMALCAPAALAATGSGQEELAEQVRAPSAILVQPATGDVVFQRNARQRRSIASTTKLMTALVTLERASLDDVMTTINYRAGPLESLGGFRGGERVTVRDLLRALLLASANDAAATLAQRVGGSTAAFVQMMNAKAREIGLKDTHYANPVGLDEVGNYSSATDLVKLTLILRRNAFFRETTNLPRVTIRSGARPRTYVNRNPLVREVEAINGVKTGRTQDAGYVLVGSASREGITVVSAVLGDPTESLRDSDSLALLRYGLAQYRVRTVVTEGRAYARAALSHRDETVDLVADAGLRRTARTGEEISVRVTSAPSELDGPLPKGARVGTIVVRQRGRQVASIPLVTAAPVDAATFLERLGTFLSNGVTLILLVALIGCTLPLVLLRRRAVRRRRRRAKGAPAA